MNAPIAIHVYRSGELSAALEFLKRARWELREQWMAQVGVDRYRLVDVNKDYFEIRGIGYADPDVVQLLRVVNAAFDPATIQEPTDLEFKEFLTGRRIAWAHDRVM